MVPGSKAMSMAGWSWAASAAEGKAIAAGLGPKEDILPTIMHYLTRRFMFSASHRLDSALLSESESERCYGLCRNVHGHNYRLEITLRGEPDPKTGFFVNVLDLKRLVDELVVDPCEHRHLNDLPQFAGLITTMENLADRIWQLIEPAIAGLGLELHEVLLAETDDNIVRLRRE